MKQRQSGTPVDVSALNQIVTGARLANVPHQILVTNSNFTSEVMTRALRLGVELIDRDKLHNLWQEKQAAPRRLRVLLLAHQVELAQLADGANPARLTGSRTTIHRKIVCLRKATTAL